MGSNLFREFPYFLFISLLFCGCAHYKSANSDQRYPHPANPCVSVIPLKTSQTLDIEEEIRKLIPGYMTMGTTGMQDMTKMGMPLLPNSIPMLGFTGQIGQTVMGRMANVLKVRENIADYEDPCSYDFPKGTISWQATKEEIERDEISIDSKR